MEAAQAESGRRIALVIGNSSYESIATLDNPDDDAALMARTLKAAGFEVTLLLDGTQSEMKRALVEFGRDLRSEGAEAGLFYYAGHGVQVRGENYLIPVNAVIQDEDEVDIEAIDVNSFLGALVIERSIARSTNCDLLEKKDSPCFATRYRQSTETPS